MCSFCRWALPLRLRRSLERRGRAPPCACSRSSGVAVHAHPLPDLAAADLVDITEAAGGQPRRRWRRSEAEALWSSRPEDFPSARGSSPIQGQWRRSGGAPSARLSPQRRRRSTGGFGLYFLCSWRSSLFYLDVIRLFLRKKKKTLRPFVIGRASCRERVSSPV